MNSRWTLEAKILHALTSLLCGFVLVLAACRPDLNRDGEDDGVLEVTPSSYTLMVGNSKAFSANGGTEPYSWVLVSGSGTINSTTGLYTAPGATGTDVIQVTDAVGDIVAVRITINPQIAVTAATDTEPALEQSETHVFVAEGGVPPYSWSVANGSGTFSGSTYTGPSLPLVETVRVTDSLGNTADAYVYALGAPEVYFMASDLNGNGDNNSGWSDSDPVNAWTDIRGYSSLSQGSAGLQPTYAATDADMNNLPSVQFDGTDCLVFGTDFLNEGSNFHFFWAGKNSGAGVQYLFMNRATDTNKYHYFGGNTSTGLGGTTDGTNTILSAVLNTVNNKHIGGYSMFTPTTAYFWGDGEIGSNSDASYVEFDSSGGESPQIGAPTTACNSGNGWDGSLSEFVYYNTALTIDQAKGVNCYLGNKYGVTLDFQADCP